MHVRIIGLGQPAAGDDGVGFAVIDALRAAPLPADFELVTARDAGALLHLLDDCERAVIVDAAIGASPGSIRVLRPAEIATLRSRPVSSHGLGTAEALELARAIHKAPARVDVVAIGIDPPRGYGSELSPSVRAAVPRACEIVVQLALAPSGDGASLAGRA